MKTKEMKGITLIALVVTIVVLLILTGVGINLEKLTTVGAVMDYLKAKGVEG